MTILNLKQQIINEIINIETSRHFSIINKIEINSNQYYDFFEELYTKNLVDFSKAICFLRDRNDIIYTQIQDQIEKYSNISIEKIMIHIIRLSFYFHIDVYGNVDTLKTVINSLRFNKTYQRNTSLVDFIVLSECIELIMSVSKSSKLKKHQLYHENYELDNVFVNLIGVDEVTDIIMANIYYVCYQSKLVSSCPFYIKIALKAAKICDNLIGDGGEHYLKTHSKSKLEKDIHILNDVGLSALAVLISEYVKQLQYTNKLKKQITNCLDLYNYEHYIECYLLHYVNKTNNNI